jgi:prepilin-type N-terminal cleavage/methylation domain-containing protein
LERNASLTSFDLVGVPRGDQRRHWRKRGFTIVELLIVFVVIAILAAITAVAYSGIQDRARTSIAQTAAR